MKKRISKNPKLKEYFMKFMSDYSELGSLEEVHVNTVERACFLFTSSSTTTKLRVVFDGSFESSSGISLISFLWLVQLYNLI